MRILEDCYDQFLSGRMDSEHWQSYESILILGGRSQGVHSYFEQRRQLHSARFCQLVESKMSTVEPGIEIYR